jgi:hypothetical protein
MSKTVKSIVKGSSDRVTGTVGSVFGTFGNVLGRARNVAVGTLHVAKDIVTLDGKSLKKDASKVGRSAVGAVTNVADGAARTVRAAVTGKTGDKKKSVRKAKRASPKKTARK